MAAVTFGVGCWLTQFLAGIDHERALGHRGAHDKGGKRFERVAAELSRSDALLIVVLQEIEHVIGQSLNGLPATCEFAGGPTIAQDAAQGII